MGISLGNRWLAVRRGLGGGDKEGACVEGGEDGLPWHSHRLADAQAAMGRQFPLDQRGPWALPRKPGSQVQIQDQLLLTSGASAVLL